MSDPPLPEKVVAIHRGLERARTPHAFGGALALAYYAEPRATIDIDLNVFVDPERHAEVLDALSPLGVEGRRLDTTTLIRDGQCRLWWAATPVDLFFAYDAIHEAMRRAIHAVPFGGERIPILSPEHLLVCKALYDRPKDWIDIEQMIVAHEELDRDDVRGWLQRAVGADDQRVERFEELARRSPPPEAAG